MTKQLWLLRKWLFVFILMVLVDPALTRDVPGPANNLPAARKRRRVAECRGCSYHARDKSARISHTCEENNAPEDSGSNEGVTHDDTDLDNSGNSDSVDVGGFCDEVKTEGINSKNRNKHIECSLCGAIIRHDTQLLHQRSCKIRCDICDTRIPSSMYDEHRKSHIFHLNREFSDNSASNNSTAKDKDQEDDLGDLKGIYHTFSKYITTKTKLGTIMDRHNFKINQFSTRELVYLFKTVFRLQKNAFKINISMGMILQHKTSGEYRFYWSSQNNQLLFDKPTLIRNSIDKTSFIAKIENTDLIEKVIRPNSEWTFVKVTNFTFFVYKMVGVPIGAPVQLPNYLIKNKGLYSLVNSEKTGKPYSDKKCFFRCLALNKGATINGLERKSNKLVKEFCDKACISKFVGVTLDQLEEISRIFDVPINVYEQEENRNTDLIFRSTLQDGKILNMHLYSDSDGESNHFSYIKEMDTFSQNYRCPKCDKIWDKSNNFHRHVRSCEVGIKKRYSNGTFQLKPTIFEELEKNGVNIPKDQRIYAYMATFDIECMLKKDLNREDTEKVSYTAEHTLVSIAVCSNVPEYTEAKCFVLKKEGDQKNLVKQMLEYLLEISDTAASLLREKYAPYIEQISSPTLEEKFENYLIQMPVLSFNGSSYDLKVLRTFLIPLLVELDSLKFVIKKGTGYMVLATEELKFLDAVFYIAPGFSYASFLKAYGADLTKSYFPYEYLDSLKKLDSKEFPSYDDFYSNLKNQNTLEPVGEIELSGVEQELIGRMVEKNKPVTEAESKIVGWVRYTKLKNDFQRLGWCMKDYLIHYNNLDVKPFIQALTNLKKYYADRGVDVFKEAVSAPGIAERIAFNTLQQDETFFLFNKKNKDVIELIKNNLVGGPALIFDRFQEAGKTKIRHNPDGKDCAIVSGYDANALYLWGMAEDMPCGMYIRRKAEDGFVKTYPTPISSVSTEWLAYLETKNGVYIRHARNGPEFRVGNKRIPVDGYHSDSNTVYQFNGCYFHGCTDCYKDVDRDAEFNGRKSFNEKRASTDEISKYIREEGYTLITIWECTWRKLKKEVKPVNQYLYPSENKYRLSEKEIIDLVRAGSIFGAVECTVRVPENPKQREYFSEMSPIFKNVTVTEDDVGDYMKQYMKETGLKFTDTRYLIGSMFGEKILLITPLLKWYLEHGLEVTKVHQLIQFNPKKCFQKFADQVSTDRRAGDKDDSKKIIAETSKLNGNSVYGHSIMDREKHTKVTVCGIDKASKLVNDPYFMGVEEFDEQNFEVSTKMKSIKYDLPLQLGFFVYQHAKLKMLSFYYDVIDRYISRDDFCLCEMDTDSLYMALSGETLDELVKPGMWDEWVEVKRKWFPRTDNPVNAAYDKREPGLFKKEWEGDGFVGLNAKTYYCYNNTDPSKDKHSAKGISRLFQLSKEDYLDVLKMKAVELQLNKGFVFKDNIMYTYELRKQGLTHFYCKRKLDFNGLSTTYLDI